MIQTGRMGTGGMLDTRDAGHEGCRTRWMQDRRDAGKVRYRTGEIQVKLECRTDGMQDRWDAIMPDK